MNQEKSDIDHTITPTKLTNNDLRLDKHEGAVPSDGKKFSLNGFEGCAAEILANNIHIGIDKAASSFHKAPNIADNAQCKKCTASANLEVNLTGSKGNEDTIKSIFTATGDVVTLNPATDQPCKEAIGKAEGNNVISLKSNKSDCTGPVKPVGFLLQTPNTADNDRHKKRTDDSDHEINPKRRKIAHKIHDCEGRTCSPKQSNHLVVDPSIRPPFTAENA